MSLFERVKDEAKKQGKSLSRVAIESGLGEKSLYKWKDHQPTPDRIKAVANTLGVSIDYLLGNTNDPYSDTDINAKRNEHKDFYRIDLSNVPSEKREKVKKSIDEFTDNLLDLLGDD